MHVVVGSEQRLAGRVQISISWNIQYHFALGSSFLWTESE